MKRYITLICLLGLSFLTIAQNKNEKLYEAVSKGEIKKLEKLIQKGADVNFVKQAGPWMKTSVLITAVNNKRLDIAKLLLENKADVNWKDGFKTSAILYAANSGSIKMVKLLLEYGADINDNDTNGNSVMTAAVESKNKEMIVFVEEKLKEK